MSRWGGLWPTFVPMLNTPLRRSFAGLVIAAPLVPALLALLGCLTFPIGDPERSQIDPGLTGAWIEEKEQDPSVLVFRPYDSRTWLFIALNASSGRGAGEEAQPAASVNPKDPGALLARLLDAHSIETEVILYKAWLTTLGGRRFLCLESLNAGTTEGHSRDRVWVVMRADTPAADELTLRSPAYESPWKDVKSSEEAEALLRTHADVEAFYDPAETTSYVRISSAYDSQLKDLFRRFGLNTDG